MTFPFLYTFKIVPLEIPWRSPPAIIYEPSSLDNKYDFHGLLVMFSTKLLTNEAMAAEIALSVRL